MVIMSNLSAGIAGAASRMDLSGAKNVLLGKESLVDDMVKRNETGNYSGFIGETKNLAQHAWDYSLAKDYAGAGAKRGGVLAARHGTNIASGVVVAGGINALRDKGGMFTDEHGNRDIAGIPFI